MKKALKLGCLCLFFMAVVRYVPVYYHTMLFNQFVEDKVRRIRAEAPLKEAILSEAEAHNLDVTQANIKMVTNDSVLRVNVVYHVPVNFFVFHQNLTFTAAGSGLAVRQD